MPKIPLLRDTKRKRVDTPNRLFRQKVYQDKRWKDLRNWYFIKNPLCELCLKEGISKEGEDVHHIVSPFKYKSNLDKVRELAFNKDNLMTLCKEHHSAIHSGKITIND